MKNVFLVLFILLTGVQSIGQETIDIEDNKVYSFVQKKAEPIEGMTVFYQSFIEEFNMGVSTSKEKEVKLRLKFVVEKDGTFGDITSESTDVDYGKEAIRVLKRMPAWKPAQHNGKIVRSAFTIPVNVRNKKNKKNKKNKSVNKKFDNRIIEKIVLDKTIETDEFEFKCDCSFHNETQNLKINQIAKNYELNDYEGMYSIIIQNNPKENDIPDFDELLTSKNLVGDKKYIDLNGIKAFHIGNDLERYNKGYNAMIMFVSGDKLINILINTEHRILTEYLVEDLKKTFKMKE